MAREIRQLSLIKQQIMNDNKNGIKLGTITSVSSTSTCMMLTM